ncbi:ribonuclease domain-containing protein [Xenorhabdus sp. KK7.4]|uniref:ribonuclease domain-containing protein n=1 Tax=Xenorhabdus sp. KK7.4 TaxID=1851572 RepID=UPI000C0428EA|nr:ribonuclease domain-containing protein [Xenorhabdus sp. KK7.4]PHM53327.1 barnase [Xenorhabdus sp. KK7.4]
MKKSALAGVFLLLAVISIVFLKDTGLSGSGKTPQNTVVAEETATPHIDVLTEQHRVASYLKQHHKLPDYYITKKQARRLGWEPRKGNLCEAVPGKAIGGDRFTNREHKLPDEAGRQWFEADVNYNCGRRGSDRLLYSNDGLIYLTLDHYNHFTRLE